MVMQLHNIACMLVIRLFVEGLCCQFNESFCFPAPVGFFTIGLSDAFLSDYLTDLELHSTK